MKELFKKFDIYIKDENEENCVTDNLIAKKYLDFIIEKNIGEQKRNIVFTPSSEYKNIFTVIDFVYAVIDNLLKNSNNISFVETLEVGDEVCYRNRNNLPGPADRTQYKFKCIDNRGRANFEPTTPRAPSLILLPVAWNNIEPIELINRPRANIQSNENISSFFENVIGKTDVCYRANCSSIFLVEREDDANIFNKIVLRPKDSNINEVKLANITTRCFYSNVNDLASPEPAIKITNNIAIAKDLMSRRYSQNKLLSVYYLFDKPAFSNESIMTNIFNGLGRYNFFVQTNLSYMNRFNVLHESVNSENTSVFMQLNENQAKNIDYKVFKSGISKEDFNELNENLRKIRKTDLISDNKDRFIKDTYRCLKLTMNSMVSIDLSLVLRNIRSNLLPDSLKLYQDKIVEILEKIIDLKKDDDTRIKELETIFNDTTVSKILIVTHNYGGTNRENYKQLIDYVAEKKKQFSEHGRNIDIIVKEAKYVSTNAFYDVVITAGLLNEIAFPLYDICISNKIYVFVADVKVDYAEVMRKRAAKNVYDWISKSGSSITYEELLSSYSKVPVVDFEESKAIDNLEFEDAVEETETIMNEEGGYLNNIYNIPREIIEDRARLLAYLAEMREERNRNNEDNRMNWQDNHPDEYEEREMRRIYRENYGRAYLDD